MTIKTASPGVFVQEIDLTRGTADAITQNVGFCAGPFEKGPVDQITLVTEEIEFKRIFGNPTDENYEYWHSINNFLEYSGTCYVVRCDDAVGDAVDAAANIVHPQAMRNCTDNFEYIVEGDTDPNLTEESETTSSLYIKNQDHYFTTLGGLVATEYKNGQRVPGTGGVFVGRTPGTTFNGIGVAVIDKGADYQITLKSDPPALSTSRTIFTDNGDSTTAIEGSMQMDGGDSKASKRRRAENYRFQEPRTAPFPDETQISPGIGIGKYVKIVPDSTAFSPERITELRIDDPGKGLVSTEGNADGLLTDVAVDGGDDLMLVNILLKDGEAIRIEVSQNSAHDASKYDEGDECIATTGQTGTDVSDPIFTIEQKGSIEGTVIQVGDAVAAITSVEREDNTDDTSDVKYITCCLQPLVVGSSVEPIDQIYVQYGEVEIGDIMADQFGNEIGTVLRYYELGEFKFYSNSSSDDDGPGIVDVIWEGKTYTRNQGIQWKWPNRPFAGELVFEGKAAVTATGNPILDENGNTVPVSGPAIVTSPTGDVIAWDGIRERWTTLYEPKQNDILFDPITGNAYGILYPNDWYAEQVAFEGLPWTQFAKRPGTSANAAELGCVDDEMNIIVYDALGNVSGIKGTILESYYLCSKFKGAKTVEGSDNYYANLVNNRSEFIYSNERVRELGFNYQTGDNGTDEGINFGKVVAGTQISTGLQAALLQPRFGAIDFTRLKEISEQTVLDLPYLLLGGEKQLTASLGEVQAAYQKIKEENVSDLDYLIQGPATDLTTFTQSSGSVSYAEEVSAGVAKSNYLIALAEDLKSCMALVSPPRCVALDPVNAGKITQNIIAWAGRIASSSYAAIDSGYKYMYDRFSDKYRYVPLNADIAGCMSNTALVSEPFFSPAGMSRGQIKHVVKLGYDPSKAQRDQIFTARVNPVVTFPGEGTVLYGDKTALGYSSAFDRINVRKLFIYCEREIAKIAKNVLFEFNDVPTRVIFKNNVNPFMRDVQSKRGCTDFLVVCDTSNNTPEVIDRNEFIADIYIKPNRSINFVQLTFVATKTGVSFGEAVAIVRRSTTVSQ